MKKKDKKEINDKIIKIMDEILIDEVDEVFKKTPENYREELDKLGFEWFDDEYPDEVEEENNAVSENRNQQALVAFFDGNMELSDTVIEIFLEEKYCDDPNHALFRRYFRQGNQNLKSLIYRGLEINPTRLREGDAGIKIN